MIWLIIQIFLLLLIAALLGGVIGWYLRQIYCAKHVNELETQLTAAKAQPASAPPSEDTGDDELQRLKWRNSYLEGRVQYLEEQVSLDGVAVSDASVTPALAALSDLPTIDDGAVAAIAPGSEVRPEALSAGGDKDELQQIKGIGPKIEGILNGLGIQTFEQIARWTPENVAWVDDHLKFKGRIIREEWIPQARQICMDRQG